MSKKSRKRNMMLAAMVGLAGASKMGLIGKMPKGVMGDTYAKAKKAFTSNRAYSGAKKTGKIGPQLEAGITKLKRSQLPNKRNMKSIFVGDDGTITKGLERFKTKEVYSKIMKNRRGDSPSTVKDFLNKAILGPKTQLKKGKMVKARGGGMAMGGMKPTKLY